MGGWLSSSEGRQSCYSWVSHNFDHLGVGAKCSLGICHSHCTEQEHLPRVVVSHVGIQSSGMQGVILPNAGISEAGQDASADAAGDRSQQRAVESPRFSVLRAHLQGLALRKPEQDASSSSSARSAAWRPMQSSVPRPQRSIGSGDSPAPICALVLPSDLSSAPFDAWWTNRSKGSSQIHCQSCVLWHPDVLDLDRHRWVLDLCDLMSTLR